MTKQDGPLARTMLAAQSDERLVRLLRDGHEQAFDEIVRRYRGPLVGFATAIVSHDRAEDVVQTALEKAHRALLADDRTINLRPWLFTIVRNGSLNVIRAEPMTDVLDPSLAAQMPGTDPEQVAERNEEMDRLFTAICALPTAQREALIRRELDGDGHGEIAAQLGTTATAVRGLIFRARTQLRNAMGAIIPLPLLRSLLGQRSAAAVAGGGASGALLGGAGAKGGAAVAAAVIALGTGIAIEKRHDGGQGGDLAVAQASEDQPPNARKPSASRSEHSIAPTTAPDGDRPHGDDGGTRPGSSNQGGEDDSAAADGSGDRGGGGSGSNSSGTGGSSSSEGSGTPGAGHPGTGGGTPEPPEHDGDSGPSGDDPVDEVEPSEPVEVEEPDHDSSDPGDGVEEPDDGDSSDAGAEDGHE